MDELMSQLPHLKRKYIYYKDYAAATMEQLFEPSSLSKAKVLGLDIVESQLYFQKDGQFEAQTLPEEVQFSCIHSAIAHDINQDGIEDLLMGGNHYFDEATIWSR